MRLRVYLGVLKELPREQAGPLLACLNHLFSEETLHSLHDDKTFGELLTILKIVAESDPKLTFRFS